MGRPVLHLPCRAAKEYHQRGLSLGMTRFETDDLLKRHLVTEDLITAEELREQIATLRRLIGQ